MCLCWFRYPWIDESSTTLAAYPRARREHTTLNIIFILRYVNLKQMEIFFSLRPEGRENKSPFPLLANKERESLSRAGVIAMCAESLLQPAFFCYAIFIYISITSASLWENVSLLMWACAHWGCHLGSQYRHRGRQCLNGSAWQAWPFVPHQYAWGPAPRRTSANQHVSLQVFPPLSSPAS